jgi:3-deoxy-manno-octulosonate cytidylyltransferase (CMP-KDO synthetase)
MVHRVLVAADDQRIVDALRPFGTSVVLTRQSHESGTDRVAEVAEQLADPLIVNVQGDEPEIDPSIVDALIATMIASDEVMGTCAAPFPQGADPADPSLVKVVTDSSGKALYFSRAQIPFPRDADACQTARYRLHVGIYAYRRDFLLQFAKLPQTPLEMTEKLEQLRALEHGFALRVVDVAHRSHGIDTPEQYSAFVQRFRTSGPPPQHSLNSSLSHGAP